MVDIMVGAEETLYGVNKDRLCNRVSYFNTMFNNDLEGALEGAAAYPEERTDSFNVFLIWVYEDSIPPLKLSKTANCRGWNWDPFEAYLLAAKFQSPPLQDKIMDALREGERITKMYHSLATVKEVYSRLDDNSALRRYFLQSLVKVILGSDDTNGWRTKDIWKVLDDDSRLLHHVLRLLRGREGKEI
jgi:hypothetical protein